MVSLALVLHNKMAVLSYVKHMFPVCLKYTYSKINTKLNKARLNKCPSTLFCNHHTYFAEFISDHRYNTENLIIGVWGNANN